MNAGKLPLRWFDLTRPVPMYQGYALAQIAREVGSPIIKACEWVGRCSGNPDGHGYTVYHKNQTSTAWLDLGDGLLRLAVSTKPATLPPVAGSTEQEAIL